MSHADEDSPVATASREGISRHRWTVTNPPTAAVVESVAGRADVESTDLPPLYDAIDPDALDAIFDHGDNEAPGLGPRVIFYYGGFEVTVEHDGWLTVATDPELR